MTNATLAKSFRRIRTLLQRQGETNKFRLMAYSRAAAQIELLDRDLGLVLADGEPAFHEYLAKVPHIGEKSREKVIQLLRTGTCEELTKLEAKEPAVQESFLDEEELKPKRKASKNLREEVTATRRPREQAQEVVDKVTLVVSKYFAKVLVCGSWRRGLPTVKDIDIALSEVREEFASESVEWIFQRIEKELGISEENVVKRGKAQTAFYHPSAFGDWHVDFWYIPPESWGAAILFATGSADFNVGMRGWLKGRGFSLNRYGLYDVSSGEKRLVAQRTEEEIFDAMGLVFVQPPLRVEFNPNYKAEVNESKM